MTLISASGRPSEGITYRLIIPHCTEPRVLLLPDSDGWALPSFDSRKPGNWEEVAVINIAVLERFGLRVATLRAIALDWDPRGERRASYYALDNLDPGWEPPPGTRWASAEDLESYPLRRPREREALAGWFSDIPAPNRVPWYRPGWFDTASAWMLDELGKLGFAAIGPIEQVRSWQRSSILRVATDAGLVYFKAVPPQWGHEPGLTAYLARRFPDRVPEVLVADLTGRHMIQAAFLGAAISTIHDIDLWRRAYRSFAEVQVEFAARLNDLRNLGLMTRGLLDIEAGIDGLLADERAMLLGQPGGLTEDEAVRLRLASPRLKAACRELAGYGIPLSLDHGDFWPGNIAAGDGRLVLFDWSDATISHPFFSLVIAVDEVNAALPGVPRAGEQVRDAYLEPWTHYQPLPRLREAFELAMLVAPLHQAMMYRDIYLPALEFRWELERMLPLYLRWLAGRV